MSDGITQFQETFLQALASVATLDQLESLEQEFFSRASGKLTALMKGLGALSPEERKIQGRALNELKESLFKNLESKRQELQMKALGDIARTEAIDVTQPLLSKRERGHLHPVTQALWDIEEVARQMGFMVEDGPEIDTDYYNFTALNILPNHPARDIMDTFYVKGHPDWCMRAHISNMQVRLMKKYGAPIRIAYPGRAFRNEATDARHEHTFYQYECLAVDSTMRITDMIGVSRAMLRGILKKDVEIRLRPKFYPFVEPGVNGEVTCTICGGKGCRVCKFTGWLEVFGAGMIHPNVLRAADIDPKTHSGFAFAFGFTRLVMLRYGIEDIRLLQSGDMRFLEQF